MHARSILLGTLLGAAAAYGVAVFIATYRWERRHWPSVDVYAEWYS